MFTKNSAEFIERASSRKADEREVITMLTAFTVDSREFVLKDNGVYHCGMHKLALTSDGRWVLYKFLVHAGRGKVAEYNNFEEMVENVTEKIARRT